MLNPIGLINDGYMELVYLKDVIPRAIYPAKAFGLFKGAKSGGTQFYDPDFECFRCSQAKIINKSMDICGEKIAQEINIDGEDLTFTNFAKYEVLPSALDIIVDFDNIINNN